MVFWGSKDVLEWMKIEKASTVEKFKCFAFAK